MKTLFAIIFVCFALNSSEAQELKVQKQLNGHYHKFQSFELNLETDKITIAENNQIVFSENIIGKKVYKASEGENYFLIANYQFSNDKVDYPVEVRVFDRMGMLVFPYRFLAPYDLPHPLLEINDNGVLAIFDPLTFKVKLIGEEIYKEFDLEKDVPFEMERASYLQINEDLLYILTSRVPLDITENASNSTLYRVNILDLSVISAQLDYNTPTTLKIIGGFLFASGVRFENLQPVGKTSKFNLNLEEISSCELVLEKIVMHKNILFAKYFNTIYELNGDLTVVNQKQFSKDERIVDIATSNNKLFVTTNISGENFLYQLSSDLGVDFRKSLNIFDIKNLNSISISEHNLIINHDSKSTILQFTEN